MAVYSHSRIETFTTCPRKYAFCYLEKAPKGPAGIEAFMGSRVHEALEWLYDEVRACRSPSEDELVARFDAVWTAAWSDDVRIVREERTAADYREIGQRALRDYHRRYAPFDQGVTVGLEMRIALSLDDEHQLVGYIDRLVKVSDGVWEIHDYKTSGTLATQQQADADRQLALYEMAVREMYADARDVELVWHYLAFDQEVRSRRTDEQLAALRADTLARIVRIESQEEFPTHVSRLCDWCDYRGACPAWAHLCSLQELAPDEHAQESGVQLVDDYMRCGDEIRALTERKAALAAALAALAQRDQLERVFGTEYAVTVRRSEDIALPSAKDPRREEVERILRESGLWERYAALSASALSRDLRDGRVPEEVVHRLADYVERSMGVRLTSKRLEG